MQTRVEENAHPEEDEESEEEEVDECNEAGCTKTPIYGVPGAHKPESCKNHKKHGMVAIPRRKTSRVRRPKRFGIQGVWEAKQGSATWDRVREAARDKVSEGLRLRTSYGEGVVEDAEEVVEEVVEDAEKVADGATETVNDVDPEEEEEDYEVEAEEAEKAEEEEEPGKTKAKGKAPRRQRPRTPDPFWKGTSPTNAEDAAGIRAAKRGDMAVKEDRNITLREAQVALTHLLLPADPDKTRVYANADVFYDPAKFEDKVVSEPYSKLIAYDPAQYGIGEGTKVVVGKAVGKVKSTSYNRVVIGIEQEEDAEKDINYVLKHAVEGQGVMTVEEDQRKFVIFLFQYTATIRIHGANHVDEDIKRSNGTENAYIDIPEDIAALETKRHPLTGEFNDVRKGKMKKLLEQLEWTNVNKLIWDVLLEIPAQDALRVVPKSFRPDLTKFLELPGSLLITLGFKKEEFGPDVTNFGIFGKKKVFDMSKKGDAVGIVREISIGLQQAFRLGRFANLQSITFPLTPGKEFLSVYDNVEYGKEELLKKKDAKVAGLDNDINDMSSNTWATQCLLSLANSSWLPHIPLAGIGIMTRPAGSEHKLKDSSVGASYSQMARFRCALVVSMNGDTTDKAVFEKVEKTFVREKRLKRKAVSTQINNDGQVGKSRKEAQGRLLKDMAKAQKGFNEIKKKIKENATDKFMSKLTVDEIDLCWRTLEKEGKDPGKRENEDHLYTDEVREVARRLIHHPLSGKEKVTCVEVSLFSKGVILGDLITSSPIRRQSRIGIQAKHTFIRMEDAKVVDILSDRVKNGESLKRSEYGVVITNVKSREFEREYVVLVVMCRAILRENGHILDDVVGPLDPEGNQITDDARSKLISGAGENCLGIPRLGEHILRTYYCSMLAKRARRLNINPEQCPQFAKDVAEIQGGLKVVMKFYVALEVEEFNMESNNGVCGVDFGATTDESNKKPKAEGGTSATTDHAFLKYAASMASSMATMAETNKMLVQQVQGQGGIPAAKPEALGRQAEPQVQQEVLPPRATQVPLAFPSPPPSPWTMKQGGIPLAPQVRNLEIEK